MPTQDPRRRGPAATLVAAALPAYLFPAVTTAVNALLIPDPAVAARLSAAAWTTIGVPSAVAAGLVALVLRRRRPGPPSARAGARAFAAAAAGSLLLAAAATAVLAGTGVLGWDAAQFTLTSAALGGGLAARRRARSGRPRRGRTARPAAALPAPTR